MISHQLSDDMKAAMKSRDKERLGVIRMLRAELKNAAIAEGGDLSAEQEQKILASYAKKRKESIESYRANGRDEMADKEQYEYGVTMSYLPEQLDEGKLVEIIKEKIAETGATGPREMGAVMKAVMAVVGSQADGSTVSALVKKQLIG